MPILKFHAKHRPGQDEFHGALDFDGLLFQSKKVEPRWFKGGFLNKKEIRLVTATTAAATTAVSATTTAAAAVITTSAAAAAGGAFFARTRDIDGNGPAIQFLAVHGCDRLLRFLVGAHGDERETA